MVDTWQAYRETDFYTCLLANFQFDTTGCLGDEPLLSLNASGTDILLSTWLASCIQDGDRISMKADFYTAFPALEPTIFVTSNVPTERRLSNESEREAVVYPSTYYSADGSDATFEDLIMTPPDFFIEDISQFYVVPELPELVRDGFDAEDISIDTGSKY